MFSQDNGNPVNQQHFAHQILQDFYWFLCKISYLSRNDLAKKILLNSFKPQISFGSPTLLTTTSSFRTHLLLEFCMKLFQVILCACFWNIFFWHGLAKQFFEVIADFLDMFTVYGISDFRAFYMICLLISIRYRSGDDKNGGEYLLWIVSHLNMVYLNFLQGLASLMQIVGKGNGRQRCWFYLECKWINVYEVEVLNAERVKNCPDLWNLPTKTSIKIVQLVSLKTTQHHKFSSLQLFLYQSHFFLDFFHWLWET